MTTTQKRGFHLPWSNDRPRAETAGEFGGDEADANPFHMVEGDTAQEEAHVTAQVQTESGVAPSREPSWPESDRGRHEASDGGTRPPINVEPGAPRPARRDNPLVVGLVKAMRQAAIASREETTTKLQGQATERVEAIRTRASDEALELRKRAEDDIAGIREWSKAEMARVKQQTDERIEERRAELGRQTERHAQAVEGLVAQVQEAVARFERDMDGFFEALLAEEDPARLAALAEGAPDAPDLELFAVDELIDRPAPAPAPEAPPSASAATPADGAAPITAEVPVVPADVPADGHSELDAADAAEAEAASVEGIDLSTGSGAMWPATALAGRAGGPAATEGSSTIQLIVHGLNSVAGISAFKSALGGLPGVQSVSVSSGERGAFLFTVHHSPDADPRAGVAGLAAFEPQVTDDAGEHVVLHVHEPTNR